MARRQETRVNTDQTVKAHRMVRPRRWTRCRPHTEDTAQPRTVGRIARQHRWPASVGVPEIVRRTPPRLTYPKPATDGLLAPSGSPAPARSVPRPPLSGLGRGGRRPDTDRDALIGYTGTVPDNQKAALRPHLRLPCLDVRADWHSKSGHPGRVLPGLRRIGRSTGGGLERLARDHGPNVCNLFDRRTRFGCRRGSIGTHSNTISSRCILPRPRPPRVQHSTISRPLGKQDATIIRLRNNAWPEFIPFRDYDTEIRRVLCSTNAIEFLNARYRLAVKARGHFSRRGCCAQVPLSGGAFLPTCNGSNEATRTPVRDSLMSTCR